MKILLAAMSLGIGGAETHIAELAVSLKARGYEVFIASGGGIYEKRLTEAGIVCVNIPLYSRNPLIMMCAEKKLGRLIKNEKFDIVHAHARIPALLCGRLQKKYGFRFVTTAHGVFRVTPFLKKMTDWGEHCFAVSEDVAVYLRKSYGYSFSNITVVPNGIDTELFSPGKATGEIRGEFKIASGARVILHVSRLDAASSICAEELISAMQTIGEKYPETVLLIAGGGDSIDRIGNCAEKINGILGRNAVIITGARGDIDKIIGDSDFFVGPSRAAMEAMSSGLPTIISGSQGHIGLFSEELRAEAERTNFCGRGLPIPDAETLARELSALLETPASELEKLGEYNRKYVMKHYSVSEMTDIYTAQYERIAKIKTGKTHDYTLCGYYGFGNTGDESLAGCIIKSLREKEPSADICVMSHSPKETSRRFSVSSISRMNIFSVRNALLRTKTFIFGGGNLLQDKTSTQSIIYYTKMIELAKKCGCNVEILANGLGPINKASNRLRTAKSLALADKISMRENYSVDLCKKLCPASAPVLVPDPALSVKPSAGALKKLGIDLNNYFVIAPKFLGDAPEKTLYDVIKSASSEYGLIPVLIAMHENQDASLCVRICEKTGALFINERLDAEEIAELLAGAEFSLCSRLHALIYSVTAECPAIAFSDDVKLSSYAGMSESRIYYFPSDFSSAEISEAVKKIMETGKNQI